MDTCRGRCAVKSCCDEETNVLFDLWLCVWYGSFQASNANSKGSSMGTACNPSKALRLLKDAMLLDGFLDIADLFFWQSG
eukprot:3128953-Amphidinium_carterae.1